MIAIDSFLIDMLIIAYIVFYLLNGTVVIIYIAPLFYLTRSISLSMNGHWPKPLPYLFNDPGLPSIFVSYAATNDFYFSGHVGMTTFLFMITFIYNHKALTIVAFLALIYTWFVLMITGGHYTNDMIIGLVAAISACLIGLKYMYELTYRLLKLYCHCIYKIEGMLHFEDKFKNETDEKA